MNIKHYISNLSSRFFRKIRITMAIPENKDAYESLSSIRENVEVKGSNFWILFCGAMLASLGLDINSAAVIIGAMLVSPLMSPILGVGLGVGINDKPLLMLSLKNFGIAVILSLLTSYLYFLISPFGVVTSEILARTSPTLLDAAIAFFGGMAGMIANSRRGGSNAIPGVAIATALMPPLCTSGFGLAKGDSAIFLGAFYLFFINAVIISLSTYIVCRMLQLPYVALVDGLTRKKVHRWISVFVIIVIIPSIYILYSVIRQVNIDQKITSFIKYYIKDKDRDALQWEKVKLDSLTLVKVYIAGENIKAAKLPGINRAFEELGLNDYRLKLIQMNMTEEQRKQMTSQAALDVLKTMEIKQAIISQRDSEIDSLNQIIQGARNDSINLRDLNKEIKILYPEIQKVIFSRRVITPDDSSAWKVPVMMIKFNDNVSVYQRYGMLPKLDSYLKIRMKLDTLKTFQIR